MTCRQCLQELEQDGSCWHCQTGPFGDYMDGQAAVAPVAEPLPNRRVDLRPYLDGTYVPQTPSVGAERDDGIQLLYSGKWHTVIAPTTSGKSWFGIWHVVATLRAGMKVAYAHFEESSPLGTLNRIRQAAPDLDIEVIAENLIWLDCTMSWRSPAEWSHAVPDDVELLILDGINAACSQHQWPVEKTDGVGAYRRTFVTPITSRGAAVLSLGHPPKATDRQGEKHGYGSTAWLDDVDGVGFRMLASKTSPIRRDHHGWSAIYTVKDRYGEVERHGELNGSNEDGGTSNEGWYYIGSMHVDNTLGRTAVTMTAPKGGGVTAGPYAKLAGHVLTVMDSLQHQRFETFGALEDQVRSYGHEFRQAHLRSALLHLEREGLIQWPEVAARKPRPGWLTAIGRYRIQEEKRDAENLDPAA
jgi:hypothetical protein